MTETRAAAPREAPPSSRRRALLAAAAFAALLAGAGRPAGAQTLTEALAAAYTNNPTLVAQRARLRATDENVTQALSNWRPTVQVTGSIGENRINALGSEATLRPRSIDMTGTQPLYRGRRPPGRTGPAPRP